MIKQPDRLAYAAILGDALSTVELVQFMGGDLSNVNAARQSYGKESEALTEKDQHLLRRLGPDLHTEPLCHTYVTLRISAPEFVCRQWYKHGVGCAFGFPDMPWSEFSLRFKSTQQDTFYVPRHMRVPHPTDKQATVIKEGNPSQKDLEMLSLSAVESQDAIDTYRHLLAEGMPREMARINLPLSVYTEWTWTASLMAVVHFVSLRDESHAQWEIQQYAKAVEALVKPIAPTSWQSLWEGHPMQLKRRVKQQADIIAKLESELFSWNNYVAEPPQETV